MEKVLSFSQGVTAYTETHLAARNFAQRTRREYLTDLQQLEEYLQTVGMTTVQGVQRSHLDGFLAALDRQALASTTRRRKVAAIRSFFGFLADAGHRQGNPAADIVPPDLESSQPRYLTQREYERLRHAA